MRNARLVREGAALCPYCLPSGASQMAPASGSAFSRGTALGGARIAGLLKAGQIRMDAGRGVGLI